MTSEEILEAKKSIAIFMGYTYYPWNHPDLKIARDAGWKTSADTTNVSKFNHLKGQRYLCRIHSQLRYDKDWSWLMPVVEKIEHMGWGCKMYLNACSFPTAGDNLWPIAEDKKIHAVFEAVSTFVEWYNRQKITIGDDNICPTTGQACDDETCMPGSECNIAEESSPIFDIEKEKQEWGDLKAVNKFLWDKQLEFKMTWEKDADTRAMEFNKWIRERCLEPYGGNEWRDRKVNMVYTTEQLYTIWKEKQ